MKPFEGEIAMNNAKYFPASTTEGGTQLVILVLKFFYV
jgi:hypothetical protein